MSTFKGIVAEFPDIRIDYFRPSNEPDAKPPLACFLSHIHTDHLQGLEGGYHAPFIYCSTATKELLVKLQRKTHRLNLQKGVIETEHCHYKDKQKLLKAIPLETPTEIEIGPEKRITVTLFDANHCVGAVMFLIEDQHTAILYTGDIRAEEWWVEYIARHPVMLPYTSGIKTLDKIYLDTSCCFSECGKFNSKREGIAILLKKLSKYPKDTIFHLNTWTFGYEDVWVALASYFKCQIHLSPYHYKLFKSVSGSEQWANGPYLAGFKLGNAQQQAIITTNPQAKIHSCERNLHCEALDRSNVVYITPIIALVDGMLYEEEGIDFGDLNNNADFSIYGQFQMLLDILGDEVTPEIRSMLVEASRSRKEAVPLFFDDEHGNRAFAKEDLLDMLREAARNKQLQNVQQPKVSADVSVDVSVDRNWPGTESIKADNGELLPTWIRFPYARHSSFEELRNFVKAFKPRDIYQCVLNEETWTPDQSVQALFGQFCSGRVFHHDIEMMTVYQNRLANQQAREQQIKEMELESQRRDLLMGATPRPDWLMGPIYGEWNIRHEEGRDQKEPFIGQLPSIHQSPKPSSDIEIQRQLLGEASTSTAARNSRQSFDTPLSTVAVQPPRVSPPDPWVPLNPREDKYHSYGTGSKKRRKIGPITGKSDELSQSPPVYNEYETDVMASEEDLPASKKAGTLRFSRGMTSKSLPDILASTKMLVDDAICFDAKEDAVARDRVEDAVLAAMGVDGMNWWGIELKSTREIGKSQKEEEL